MSYRRLKKFVPVKAQFLSLQIFSGARKALLTSWSSNETATCPVRKFGAISQMGQRYERVGGPMSMLSFDSLEVMFQFHEYMDGAWMKMSFY